ncbi:MAG: hypothetical protein ACM3NI_00180 [Bacteroidota bacterium]
MSATMIVIVLLAWTVAGVLVAIVFGRMIQASHTSLEDDDALPASNDTLRYFRRHQRKPSSATRVRHGTAKRMTG